MSAVLVLSSHPEDSKDRLIVDGHRNKDNAEWGAWQMIITTVDKVVIIEN